MPQSVVVPIGQIGSPGAQSAGATASLTFAVSNPATTPTSPSAALYFSLPVGVSFVGVDDSHLWTATVDQQMVTVVSSTPLQAGESRPLSLEVAGPSPSDGTLTVLEAASTVPAVPGQMPEAQLIIAPSIVSPPLQVPPSAGQ
jgi:hypothetical protein